MGFAGAKSLLDVSSSRTREARGIVQIIVYDDLLGTSKHCHVQLSIRTQLQYHAKHRLFRMYVERVRAFHSSSFVRKERYTLFFFFFSIRRE